MSKNSDWYRDATKTLRFVAYAIPEHDLFNLRPDGLGFVEIGTTEDEARAKLAKAIQESDPEGEYHVHVAICE